MSGSQYIQGPLILALNAAPAGTPLINAVANYLPAGVTLSVGDLYNLVNYSIAAGLVPPRQPLTATLQAVMVLSPGQADVAVAAVTGGKLPAGYVWTLADLNSYVSYAANHIGASSYDAAWSSGAVAGAGASSGVGGLVGVPVAVSYPNAFDLEIVNDALSRLSEITIGSFSDNSRAARLVSRLYPRTRATMFASADWGFARSRVLLSNQVTGVYPWLYQYPMPPNVSKARYVAAGNPANDGRNLSPRPFEEGIAADDSMRVVWCDVSPAVLVYTQEVLNNAVWDSSFVSCFTWQLAAELAFPITGSGQVAQEMAAAATRALGTQDPGQPMAVMQQQRGPSTTTMARGGY